MLRSLVALGLVAIAPGCGAMATPDAGDGSLHADTQPAGEAATRQDVEPTLDATTDASIDVRGVDASTGLDTVSADARIDVASSDVTARPDAHGPDVAVHADVITSADVSRTDSGPPDTGTSNAFPYGPYCSYRPGPTTSGVRAGTVLVPYTNQFGAIVDGTLTLRTPGVTLANFDIRALIVIAADGITLENCRIRGPATLPSTPGRNLVTAYGTSATNLTVQDCTLAADVPDHDSQGIQGKSFHAARNDIYNVVDGIDPLNSGAVIEANYIHDLAWFSPDSNHSDNHSHNDCIQFEGGSATARCNNLQAFLSTTVGDGPHRPYDQANSAMLMSANTTPATTALVISHNWIDGGAVSINVGPGSYSNFGIIEDNIFGDHQMYQADAILLNSPRASIGLTITDNTFGNMDRTLIDAARNGTTVDTGNGVHGG